MSTAVASDASAVGTRLAPLHRTSLVDDLDSRPGSSTSLLRTIVGVTMRAADGWLPTAHLIALARAVGLSEPTARSALARVRAAGLLVAASRDGVAGHALNPAAVPLLERGDRRIFNYRQMAVTDAWCLVSFSIPESRRAERHQLRRRLAWIGCGTVAPALWVCPEHLAGEVSSILTELRLTGDATVFTGARPAPDHELAAAAAHWWELGRIRELHEHFLAVTTTDAEAATSTADPATPALQFRTWIHTLDAWRMIPYLDPGLPAAALPADWPGSASLARFAGLRSHCEASALAFALGA